MRLVVLASLMTALASPALADSPLSFGGSAGYDIPVEGEFIGAGNSNVLTLSSLNGSLTGTGVLKLRGTDFKDAYETAQRYTFEVRYAMTETTEFFGALSYSRAEGKTTSIGCLETTSGGTTVCTTNLLGTFADYQQYGLELGYRQWLNLPMLSEQVHPYFAVRGGLAKTDAIHAFVSTPTAGLAHWRLYDDEIVYTIGADLGATYMISPNAEIGGEVGIRYQSKLKEIDSDFGAIGLGSINNNASRLSVPVSIRLNAAF